MNCVSSLARTIRTQHIAHAFALVTHTFALMLLTI